MRKQAELRDRRLHLIALIMTDQEELPSISDYGLIGNCRTAALVSNRGSIDWGCFPYFDSETYFARIVDQSGGGFFSIQPSVPFRSRQKYVPDTNVLETVFETSSGKARLLDCFSATTERRKRQMFFPSNEILRKLEGISGTIPFTLHYAPKPHYNAHTHIPLDRGKMGIEWSCGHDSVRFMAELEDQGFDWYDAPGGPEVVARFALGPGQSRFFSLSYHQFSPAIIPALGEQAELRLKYTMEYWREWASRCAYQGPYREDVCRSALALKLMTFAPSGAIVAAPTSSLPEYPGGERNWDYRYAWVRDASFTVRALTRLGYHEEARAYLNWMLDTGAGARGRYQVMYTLFGGKTPPERKLDWLSGYRGAKPVRMGNAAAGQFQLDIFGEVLDSALTFAGSGMVFDGDTRKYLIGMGRRAYESWRNTDDGIWEPRTERMHHTHSKVMAWVALDRLITFSKERGLKGVPVDQYASECARIREAIEARGFDAVKGAYTGAFGSPAMDAALLRISLVGYCAPNSARMQGTIDQVRRELARGELVYRYVGMDDGLPGREGCFGVCSFWLVDALARAGRRDEAVSFFERFLARSNPVRLWPEEIDPDNGEFLGNYPQAFTHIGLINSALTLEETAA
jgi:GH15 family glucan-1,4-alpha-glucosidase